MAGNCENCLESVNECVRKRKVLFCGLIWALILIAFAARLIKYYSASSSVQSAQSSNGTWDYLVFAQYWPISFCKTLTGKKKNPSDVCNLPKNETWIIHGLWPSKNSKSPKFCSLLPFNMTELEPIRNELEEYWVSTKKNMTKSSFWEYEWSKHGTCGTQTERLNTQLKYFNQILEWYKQYNVTKALNECGIHPDDSKLYKNADLADCFKKQFNVDPQISCLKVNNKQMLHEVKLCIDRDLNAKNCQIFGAQKLCKDDFIYPANVVPKL